MKQNRAYGTISLSIFWLLHTSAKKQGYPFIPSSVLTAWNMEKQLHKKPEMLATKSGHLEKKYI